MEFCCCGYVASGIYDAFLLMAIARRCLLSSSPVAAFWLLLLLLFKVK